MVNSYWLLYLLIIICFSCDLQDELSQGDCDVGPGELAHPLQIWFELDNEDYIFYRYKEGDINLYAIGDENSHLIPYQEIQRPNSDNFIYQFYLDLENPKYRLELNDSLEFFPDEHIIEYRYIEIADEQSPCAGDVLRTHLFFNGDSLGIFSRLIIRIHEYE